MISLFLRFSLAIDCPDEQNRRVHYARNPFHREPDFGVTSVNYDLDNLVSRAEEPK